MAKRLEELAVFQRASEFWEAVTALLEHEGFRRNRNARDQIADAVDSIVSNISEGFEQSTDRGFARYLYIAKGSNAEVCTRLRQAHRRRYITAVELARSLSMADRLARMLASLIRYLEESDFKDRGRFKSRDRDKGLKDRDPDQDRGTQDRGTQDRGTRDRGTRD